MKISVKRGKGAGYHKRCLVAMSVFHFSCYILMVKSVSQFINLEKKYKKLCLVFNSMQQGYRGDFKIEWLTTVRING